MFASLFHRAQATVDNAIGHAVNRALMAVPFLVAAGFGTAALSSYMTRTYGTELGYLAVAALYVIIGFVAVAVLRPRAVETPAEVAAQSPSSDEALNAREKEAPMSPADKELVASALAALAPLAVGPLARLVVRNLPLIAAIAAALFVFIRSRDESVSAATRAVEPEAHAA